MQPVVLGADSGRWVRVLGLEAASRSPRFPPHAATLWGSLLPTRSRAILCRSFEAADILHFSGRRLLDEEIDFARHNSRHHDDRCGKKSLREKSVPAIQGKSVYEACVSYRGKLTQSGFALHAGLLLGSHTSSVAWHRQGPGSPSL